MELYSAYMELTEIWDRCPDLRVPYGLYSMFKYSDRSWRLCCRHVDKILVDSGAYSFQRGTKRGNLSFDQYVERYITFVRRNTRSPKITGFFEVDTDITIGVEAVNDIRKDLNKISDKIIPVWHKTRSIDDFYRLCEEYKGRRIAITGRASDCEVGQYNLFINAAHKYGCKFHILGCTDFRLIKGLNLGLYDSVDSGSWRQTACFGSMVIPKPDLLSVNQLSDFYPNLKTGYPSYINLGVMNVIAERYRTIDRSVKVT